MSCIENKSGAVLRPRIIHSLSQNQSFSNKLQNLRSVHLLGLGRFDVLNVTL